MKQLHKKMTGFGSGHVFFSSHYLVGYTAFLAPTIW